VEQHCRDCKATLRVSLEGMLQMADDPNRRGRPIKCLCVQCSVKYERPPAANLRDLRGRGGK
jgi:hypothetical protein